MSTRNSDINLIIRAKTEGEKAIASMAAAVDHLVHGAGSGSQEFAELGRIIGTLDKAATSLSAAQDKAAASISRQAAAVHAANAGISEQRTRIETLQRGYTILAREAEKAFVGPRRENLTPLLKTVKAEISDAQSKIAGFERQFERSLNAVRTTRSGLLDLRGTTARVGEAQNEAKGQVDRLTASIERQAEAQRRNSTQAADAQNIVNSRFAPGLVNTPATQNGAGFGALIEQFQRLEAEAAKVREAVDPIGTSIQRAEQQIAKVQELARGGYLANDAAITRERQLREALAANIAELDGSAKAARAAAAATDIKAASDLREAEALRVATEAARARNEAEAAKIRASIDPVGAANNKFAADVARLRELQQAGALSADEMTAAEKRLAEQLRTTIAELDGSAKASRAAAAAVDAQKLREAAFAFQMFEAAARKGAAAMREADDAAQRDTADLLRLRNAMDPVAAIQAKLNAELDRFRQLAAQGKLSVDELAAAEKHLTEEAQRAQNALNSTGNNGRGGLFGLRPYELTNLSYQINDVVTGLASGQRLGQVVAQQGGQILQLFPQVGGAIVGALTNPLVLAGVATFALLAATMSRAADEAERLRDTSADLALSADGALYDSRELDESAKALRGYGASIGEATAALKIFVDAGLNPERLDQFGRSAQDLADVTGAKVPEAAKKLADAFSGGYEAVAKLDDELKFLTATERESIKQAFEDGRAQEGRARAFAILTEKLSEAAEIQRGPATEATRALGKGYNDLMDKLADTTVIKGLINLFGDLGRSITRAAGGVEEFSTAEARLKRRAEIVSQIGTFEKANERQLFNDPLTGEKKYDGAIRNLRGQLAEIDKQISREKQQRDRVDQDTRNADSQAQRSADLAVRDATDRQSVQTARLNNERGITTERERQLRITVAERTARASIESSNPRASDEAKNAFVAGAVEAEKATIRREDTARKKAADAERARLAKQTVFIAPVDGRLSSGFGPRVSPGGVGSTFHRGQDYAVPVGTAVRAPADGVVIETGTDAKLGRFIVIDHGNKVISKFGHLSDNQVVGEGQVVTQGQTIARSGNTGSATTGPHLHHQVTVGGKPVDPRKGLFPTDGPSRFETNRAEALQDAEERREQIEARSLERQEDLNLAIRHRAEDQQRVIDGARAEAALYGTALLAEQRRQTVVQAELDLRQKVEDANRDLEPGAPLVTVTEQQVTDVRKLAGALFDVKTAREQIAAQRDDVQRPIDDLEDQKQVLRDQAEFLRSIGDFDGAEQIEVQIRGIGGAISEAIDKAIAFYSALTEAQRIALGILDERQLKILIDRLQQLKNTTQEWGRIAGLSALDVARAFAGAAVSAFTNFINKVASGKNVFKSFVQGIREFAATFIQSIAQMILQLLAFAGAVTILRALGVPVPTNAFGASLHHTGGIVGQGSGQRRRIDPAVFTGAMRYHEGGIVGLAPNEQAIIAKRGEEVLTEGDPRHRNNGGLAGGTGRDSAMQPINIVNAFDREEAAEMLLRTKSGERTILNFISDNRSAVKAALG
jgi:murein DD-endopeptidase MepM/ murein hydrolase activator NlpD